MQVSVEKKDGLVRVLNVTVEAANCATEFETLTRKYAKDIKLDGFRPGKVPLSVVKQKFAGTILQEVASELMRSTFAEAAQKAELVPAGMPSFKVTQLGIDQDFQYEATIEIFPEIQLASLSGKTIEFVKADIKEADLNTIIDRMREQHAEHEIVDRPAENLDEVIMDFEGFIDGEPLPNGKAEEFKLKLGNKTMIDGFEEGILGKKAQDEFELKCQFPSDYHHNDVAGKDVLFKIKIHSVSGLKLPPLDETFFAKFNLAENTLEAFKANVSKDLERDLHQRIRSLNKKAVFDALLEANPISVPTPLVEEEIDHMLNETKRSLGKSNEAKKLNIPRDIFRDEATRRVHLGLLVQEVIKSKQIKLDEERLKSEIELMSQAYDDAGEYKHWVESNPKVKDNFAAMVIEDQVSESLANDATVVTVEKSYNEIINPTGSGA